ncbi:MAG: PEP-utilizing enzyme, partial [Myxococcota bacterium]
RFESVRDVEIALAPLREAIARVVASYHAGGEPSPDKAQILIQPMLSHVSSSGVVFTRYQHTDSPYYTIAYDDITGTTDTVTGGRGGQTLFISRTLPENRHPPRWKRLLNVIRELETYFPNHPLDIEFAITQDERIVILQCRRLAMPPIERSLEQSAAEMLQELELRFERCQAPQPPLQGSTTILSDMADWNPAEMLGEKPNTLAYSLYRELITDHVWHQARSSLGYFDVGAASLMLSFARKSYIDTRASFNSLTPAAIQPETRSILLEHYLNKLRNDPTLHDKVEFEILHTCYDLTVRQRLDEVEGLSPAQREEVAQSLLELTHTLVDQEVVAADLKRLDQLDERIDAVHQVYRSRQAFWECFNAAFLLLGHVKQLGTLPFARLARLGFVAQSWIHSLCEVGALEREEVHQFLTQVPTVATQFRHDVRAYQQGTLTWTAFIHRYGHLRMSTYDLTAPRYDQIPREVWDNNMVVVPHATGERVEPTPPGDLEAINRLLREHGCTFDAQTLFSFIASATQAREEGKFRFTRALSDALEYLAQGGKALGLSREELQFLTLPTVLRFRNPEFSSPAKATAYLRQRVGEKRHERHVHDLIKLPAVIASVEDIGLVHLMHSRPNFISNHKVTAEVVWLTHENAGTVSLEGRIVAIEHADPGYDWIFASPIAGLITQYGGAASHMAIRCTEFDLPGAIGCGEALFQRLRQGRLLHMDCEKKEVSIV